MHPDTRYFLQCRTDVAGLVPPEARLVLDVGCGFGALGRCLIAERGCELHGIERNAEADRHLSGVYKHYIIGDVESAVQEIQAKGHRYDCVIFADILEHLVDPWQALKAYSGLLAPEGVVVASIPNVRNLVVIADLLLRGRWLYRPSGLMDRTHLRFFTRREIHELFNEAGLSIERMEVNRDRYRLSRRIFAVIPTLLIPDLDVCQYRVVARRS